MDHLLTFVKTAMASLDHYYHYHVLLSYTGRHIQGRMCVEALSDAEATLGCTIGH